MNTKASRFAALVRRLEACGWRVEHGRKHYVAYPPDRSMGPVTLPKSPGGAPKSHMPYRTLLRQRGFHEEF